MKLIRLRIEQFRQFRTPIEIGDFAPGLNLFTGPNEAGKSTIVAAIRAAFFERHRSGSVEDLRPWGDSAAVPTVELDFELDGEVCRLVKSFLAKKRCELTIGSHGLDGAEAEDRLAELLGFMHAGKGASKAEHWGIPGLLWIQQGAAHELRDAVGHATDHLRSALNESLGEVAASGGDELLATVQTQRGELLTEKGGHPRGAYKDALDRAAELDAVLRELDTEIDRYRQRVDALAKLRVEHAADEAERPWLDFRARQQAAGERLAEIRRVETTLATELERAVQVEGRINLLRSQIDAFVREEQAADKRADALEQARQALVAAGAPVEQWTARRAESAQALERARAALYAARRAETRATLIREVEDTRAKLEGAAAQLARAESAQRNALALQGRAAACELRPAELKALRAQDRELADLRLQQAVAATRLSYALEPGRSIEIGTQTLTGSGEQRLLAETTLILPGLGRLEIAPGGADLAELAARAADLEVRQQSLLARHGLASLDAAEARQLEHARLQAALDSAQATLAALAPEGLDALRAEHARLQARAEEASQKLAALAASSEALTGARAGVGSSLGADDEDRDATRPIARDAVAVLGVADAEAAERHAAHSNTSIQQKLHQAELAAANAQTAFDAAARELASARAVIDAPDRALRVAAASRDLTDARAEQAAVNARIATLQQRVAEARPDILQQDVERYRNSADQLEQRHRDRRDELMRLEVELQTEGARGQEERRAEFARDHAQAARRATELGRRAQALDLLLRLLRDKRRALTRRLQAPLQKHLNHYLQLLFPQANLEIDENLTPGPLTRPTASGNETGEFEALSFGAREQMGVISRLAYADLLAEAGRPTLVILDDALVHSDAERLAQMKRVLFDAATRHQILLFTCHPANWRDLGVAARSLEGFRMG
ncbi:AAA family ATPase [Rhodocyclaceae bacterium SMB388]